MLLDDGFLQLNNGMSIMLETQGQITTPIITVDINGIHNKPNRIGYDTFSFIIDKNDVVYPLGHPDASLYNNADENCNIDNNSSNTNGFTCAYKAFYDKDYWKNLKD